MPTRAPSRASHPKRWLIAPGATVIARIGSVAASRYSFALTVRELSAGPAHVSRSRSWHI
ncbi:hypothetical protein STSP_03930 [Streptomyces jeddahensis]|uniref:Uncharacterized protein n=1 Tax=Streptomyces jeddahensis TaxID=1716141 RepID=A0A177HZC3_9ACTN|nr:hypothetical protein STSP_03930 [Streptomyces jeddahensis]